MPLCQRYPETTLHLMAECAYTRSVWAQIATWTKQQDLQPARQRRTSTPNDLLGNLEQKEPSNLQKQGNNRAPGLALELRVQSAYLHTISYNFIFCILAGYTSSNITSISMKQSHSHAFSFKKYLCDCSTQRRIQVLGLLSHGLGRSPHSVN